MVTVIDGLKSEKQGKVGRRKLTGHSQLDANVMTAPIYPGGRAIIVAHILFHDRLEHQQKSGLVSL